MILYRYFAREIFTTMLAVAAIVLAITMGWRFSGYLNDAAAGMLTKEVLFLVMAYRLPGFLELILPISFFLGIMLAYGRLHADSEMVVLASCGMSPRKLVVMTLLLSLIVMLVTAAITLWLKPAGESRVETLITDQRNLTEFDTLAPGRFQTLRTGRRVTYAEELSSEGTLSNLFINEQKENSSELVTVQAEQGNTMVDAEGNRFLVLKNGTQYSGTPGQAGYRLIEYEEYGQFIEKEESRKWGRRRQGIPTLELIEDRTPRNLSELHWRVSVILMIPVIGVMAIPLSRVNPRQGRFSRLTPGMLLCFLYVGGLSTGRSALEGGRIPLDAGLWWLHGIYIVIVIGLFYLDPLFNAINSLRYRRVAPDRVAPDRAAPGRIET